MWQVTQALSTWISKLVRTHLAILRSLKLVKQLCSEHDIEVFLYSCHCLRDSISVNKNSQSSFDSHLHVFFFLFFKHFCDLKIIKMCQLPKQVQIHETGQRLSPYSVKALVQTASKLTPTLKVFVTAKNIQLKAKQTLLFYQTSQYI